MEPHAAPGPLLELHADLGEALSGSSMPVEERGYKPHVTLARARHGDAA